MRSILLLTIFTGFICAGRGQTPFVKALTTDRYNPAIDVAVINNDRYACITENNLYLVNSNGEVLRSIEIKGGSYSALNSVTVDDREQLRIVNHVLDGPSTQWADLYTFNKDGQPLGMKTILTPGNNSYEKFQVLAAPNRSLYVVNKHYINGECHLDLRFLNEQLNEQWRIELADTVYFNYGATVLANGNLSISYQDKNSRALVLTTITPQGASQQISTAIKDVMMNHTATSDGGFLFCGYLGSDALLVKTDAGGQELWRKTYDGYKDDMFMVVRSVPDGYVALGLSGLSSKDPDRTEADIILFKTDAQGNKQWVKAFGGGSTDNAKQLQVLSDERLLLLASSSLPGANSSPLLISTNKQGETGEPLPLTLQPHAEMVLLQTGKDAKIERAVRTGHAGGNFLNGMHSLNKGESDLYAAVGVYTEHGELLAKKMLTQAPSTLKTFKPTRDGHYMAVVQFAKSLFGSQFYLIKLNAQGDSVWRKETGVNGQILDVLPTTDGGYLFTGTTDNTFINYELYLLKTDANGNVEWRKSIGVQGEWECGRSVIQTQEHDYIIAGNTQKEFDEQSSVYVIKVDKNGNTKWSTSLKGGISIDVASNIIHGFDNNYILTGYTNDDVVLVKLNTQGNVVWKKTYDLHKKDAGVLIRGTLDDGYLVACNAGDPKYGVRESFAAVMKLSKDGDKQWVKYYGVPGKQTTAAGIMQIDVDVFLLTGTTQKEYGTEEQFMARVTTEAPAEEPIGTAGISVYPNPVQTSTKMIVTSTETGDIHWAITDGAGKTVETGAGTKTGSRFEKTVYLSKYAAGLYQLKVWLNNQVYTKRLLVVHSR